MALSSSYTSLTYLEETRNLDDVAKELSERSGHRQVSILITGKLGTGKSALINGLAGEEVAPETDSIESVTTEVKDYICSIRGITVKIWDSPGITVGADDEAKNLSSIAECVKEVDLVLYCLKMDDLRIQKQDILTIGHLTQAFGPDFWTNAIFALTFANKVLPPRNHNDPSVCKEFFQDRWMKWSKELKEALYKAEVPHNVVQSVAFIPAGHYSDPSLPDGRTDWLAGFWSICFQSMKNQAQPTLLNLNLEQMKPYQKIDKRDYAPPPVPKQPLALEIARRSIAPGAGALIGVIIGGVAVGPVGIAVGAVLGGVTGFTIHATVKHCRKS